MSIDWDQRRRDREFFSHIIEEPKEWIQTPENLRLPEWERDYNPDWLAWNSLRDEYVRSRCSVSNLEDDLRESLEILRDEGLIEEVIDFDSRNWGMLSDGSVVLIDMGCTQRWALESIGEVQAWRIDNGYDEPKPEKKEPASAYLGGCDCSLCRKAREAEAS